MKRIIMFAILSVFATAALAAPVTPPAPKASPAPKAPAKAAPAPKATPRVDRQFSDAYLQDILRYAWTNLTANVTNSIQTITTLHQNIQQEYFSLTNTPAPYLAHYGNALTCLNAMLNGAYGVRFPSVSSAYPVGKSISSTSVARYGFATGARWSVAFKDSDYINTWLSNHINVVDYPHVPKANIGGPSNVESWQLANVESTRKYFVGELVWQLAVQNGLSTTVVPFARRLEMVERRLATPPLPVTGTNALVKTQALTDAINTGNGLFEALQAFTGDTLPSLQNALVRKQNLATAIKTAISNGVKDPAPDDVKFIGSWLGIQPTAAWIKQYNDQ